MARAAFQIPQNAEPTQGSIALAVPFDFTAVQAISGDLALEQMQGLIGFVQSIFIDNRLNGQPFTIVFSGTQYTIQCRAGRQGIFPVIAAIGALAFTARSNGGIVVPTLMMNTKQNYFVWDV